MRKRMWSCRGQAVAEYAIVAGVVIAAIVGMQIYLKRGMQAKWKTVSNMYGSISANPFAGEPVGVTPIAAMNQYEPYYAPTTNVTVSSNNSSTTQAIDAAGKGTTTFGTNETSSGTENRGGSGVLDNDADWH